MAVRRAGMLLWACVFHALVSCSPAGVAGDIPNDVVYTDLHKMVRLGDSVVLKCQFRGAPLAAYWKKGDDPRTAPNLVSWIPGDPVTGLCEGERPCQIMEMNENFSLIIKEVSIAEQGRYICRVSSYKGILIHNFTDIRVFSPPKEPFPVIDECVESASSTSDSTQSCSVLTNDSMVSISCAVTNYYSDLDLFFLHGSQKIRDAATNVWINDDGTMNKSVYIKASASETHYVCVASRIPGSNDQRAATVMVKSFRPTGTESTAVPVIVIMVFIVGIGLVMFFVFRRRRRHTGSGGATKIGSDEEVPMLRAKAKLSGRVSFYELWSLAYETREIEKLRIHKALTKLSIKYVTEGFTPANTYDLLCKWKEEHKSDDLAELLREALESADLKSRWIQLCEQRKRTDSKVSQEKLEQIILEIENPEKIQEFLGELIPNRPGDMDVKGKGKDIIEEAMRVTQEWGKGPFEENPFASLSLALESSGCSPLDRKFFDISDKEKQLNKDIESTPLKDDGGFGEYKPPISYTTSLFHHVSKEYIKMAQDVESLDAAVREGELSIKIEKRLTKLMNSHDGVKGLKGRFRSLEVVIANNSSYNLLFKKGYFSSGTWFSRPDDCIKPGDATIATLANIAGSILCGVTGGMSWEIEGTEKFLVLGLTNPTIGCYKLWIGVRKEPEPEYGYEHSEDDTYKLLSQNGFALLGRMGESKIAMKKFIFAIGDGN